MTTAPDLGRHAPHPHPRETAERCSVRAQLRGDPLLGTAFPAAQVLLVEQPGPWGRRGLADSHFGAEAAQQLERRAAAAGIRVLAVRRPRRHPRADDGTLRWAYVDTRHGVEGVRWHTYRHPAELASADLAGAGESGDPDTAPLYLVCAHSKRDACCALRGRPVAAALDDARPGRVWECSHLGGDRFAANVLVLPTGLMYGQLLPVAAEEFAAAADADEVVGALLRGRIGMAPAAQAALAYAHEHLAVRRRADLKMLRTVRADDGTFAVTLRTPHADVVVSVRPELVDAVGLSCQNPRPNAYVAHRPFAIRTLD